MNTEAVLINRIMNQPFITLVGQILAAKKQPPSSPFSKGELPNAGTSALEKQIDDMVYALYIAECIENVDATRKQEFSKKAERNWSFHTCRF